METAMCANLLGKQWIARIAKTVETLLSGCLAQRHS